MFNKIIQDPSLIKNIDTETCYPCEEGSKQKICRPNSSTEKTEKTEKKCKEECREKYNSSAYYYDKGGTKFCYCGNTKTRCEQLANVKACTENEKKSCKLKKGSVIKNQKGCQDECKKILNSDGLYCKEDMNNSICVCTNPGPLIENYKEAVTKEVKENSLKDSLKDSKSLSSSSSSSSSKCLPGDSLRCPNGDNVKTKDDDVPSSYLNFSNADFLLEDSNTNPYKLNAFCGCDKDILKAYNDNIKCGTTLRTLWRETVILNSASPNPNLKEAYSKTIQNFTKGDPKILDILIAYDLCQYTNEKYDRNVEKQCPPITDDFGGWLHCHLNPEFSSSGEWLNRGVKFLVFGMLLHVLFRTFVPKYGNLSDSLIYAMFLPRQFLTGNPAQQILVFAQSIMTMLLVMGVVFTGITPNAGFYTALGLLITGIIISIWKGRDIIPSFLQILPVFLIILLITYNHQESNEGEAFIKYFIPTSLNGIPSSGIAFSIYAIIFGGILSRFSFIDNIYLTGGVVLIAILSSAIQALLGGIMAENFFGNPISNIYYGALGILFIISALSMFILNKSPNSRYLVSYTLSTLFGILPIATFLILINFAIASYSPAIAIFFLVLYRISGSVSAMFPNSAIGTVILKIFGKRKDDKWVLPFLPLVSNLIEVFYWISGDPKPGYFNPRAGVSSGTANTDMWWS